MPLKSLRFKPGIVKEVTSLSNENGWFNGDKIRFRFGFPEKIGGWIRLSDVTFLGTCRSLWNWTTLNGNNLLSVGTNIKFYIEEGGSFYDVTPLRATVNPMLGAQPPATGNPFTTNTTSGTANKVLVTDNSHGASTGDFVTFSGATAVGGLTLNGEFQITYVNSNQYTITASSNASSIATGGGAAVIAKYQIKIGLPVYEQLTGWNAGAWGGTVDNEPITLLNGAINNSVTTITVDSTTAYAATGTLLIDSELITYTGKTSTTFTGCVRGASGTIAASHADNTIVYDANAYGAWGESYSVGQGQQLRLWSQSNYGQDLVFSPRGGALYYWEPSGNVVAAADTVGTLISGTDVPATLNQVMVSDATRITICFGCNDYGAYGTTIQDPMLIRWSDQENVNQWTPAATNQAGSYRLSRGSEIVEAIQTRQEILVWTDAALYAMQYLGPPFVWGFTIVADNISIISPNAAATANNITYWMGTDKFYFYSGRTETLPCALRRYIYDDINMSQSYQFFSGTNEGFNEVWWFYCSADSTLIDRYVVFNYLENSWYYGNLSRTAWLDSSLRKSPIAATITPDSFILQHETGVDDGATSPPTPIEAYIESAYFDIDDGDSFSFVRRLLPDVTFEGSDVTSPEVTFELNALQNSGSGYNSPASLGGSNSADVVRTASVPVEKFTGQVFIRVRGREMAIKISSNGLGTQWQLGTPRIDIRPDGRR